MDELVLECQEKMSKTVDALSSQFVTLRTGKASPAVLEKIERDTYDSDENRETNAIRAQALYVQRPQKAFAQVMTQIKSAYYPRLRQGARVYYDNLIAEIMDIISQFSDVEIGRPLSDTYLIGYYMQKKELYTSKRIEKEEE